MFTVAELKSYMAAAVPYTYYANEFAATSADDSAYVRLTGGFKPSEWTNMKRPSLQVLVRGAERNGPAAETVANEIYTYLHRRADFTIGTTRIAFCAADQSVPLYIGRDENRRPMYSVNFTLTLLD
ncbi:minor capsid protein [Paenibacillus xanthanilyticus]|uniref:Minor capsid protein n=1 Tax=Paenibacillus xanthanilyticus TaxID=1783531 RepID=A0ABV8KC60_9BACL